MKLQNTKFLKCIEKVETKFQGIMFLIFRIFILKISKKHVTCYFFPPNSIATFSLLAAQKSIVKLLIKHGLNIRQGHGEIKAFLEFLFLLFFPCVINFAKNLGKILIKKINYNYHIKKRITQR